MKEILYLRVRSWMYKLRRIFNKFKPRQEGSLEKYAKTELRAAGLFDKDSDYSGELGKAVMELVKLFASQRHSGWSAPLAIQLFTQVASFEPLLPLQGTEDEWQDRGSGVFQNKRCSRVFKEDGQAYDIEGKVFREPSGACYTSRDSRVFITFPYMPKREYIDVPGVWCGGDE